MNHVRFGAIAVAISVLLGACKDPPPPPEPPKPPPPKWNVPPPAAPPAAPAAPGEPEGPSLAKLGLNDPLVKLAKHSQCAEAVGGENAYLAPADIYLGDKKTNALLRKLFKKIPALQAALGPAPKDKKEADTEAAELEKNIEAIATQVKSLGKMAPAQLLLDKGTSLARIGKTAEARAEFYPLFQKKMYAAAEHGLLGACLLEPEHWPESLRWDPWSEEELPTISALTDGEPGVGLDGIDAAIGAVKGKDEASAEALAEEVRKVAKGLYFSDTEPLLNWTLLSVLARANPTDPRVWEWRGVVASRLGEKGASRADLVRGCFLGGETACVLAWWAKNDKTIAIAGDSKHYWPL